MNEALSTRVSTRFNLHLHTTASVMSSPSPVKFAAMLSAAAAAAAPAAPAAAGNTVDANMRCASDPADTPASFTATSAHAAPAPGAYTRPLFSST